MKKQLLCTSAIALGVAAVPASAQDWDVSWGGFINTHVAYVDTNVSGLGTDGIKQFSTGEIIFSPSVTLDNGLTFGANVQFEAQNNAAGGTVNNVDESYIQISSDTFGRLVVGAENSAGYLLSTGAPSVHSLFVNSPSISAFIPLSGVVPFNFRQAGISSFSEVGGNNDVNRITYYTPNFNGLTVGVSYAPNSSGNASQGFGPLFGAQTSFNGISLLEDIIDVGANYSQTFGSASVTVSGRYGTADSNVDNGTVQVWQVGANVGFGGFSIGGSYGDNDNNNGAAGVGLDQTGWSLGVSYDTAGPWSFSAETYQGTYQAPGPNLDYSAYAVAASRQIGPGVDWDLYVIYAEATGPGPDVDGTIVGTAINLSF